MGNIFRFLDKHLCLNMVQRGVTTNTWFLSRHLTPLFQNNHNECSGLYYGLQRVLSRRYDVAIPKFPPESLPFNGFNLCLSNRGMKTRPFNEWKLYQTVMCLCLGVKHPFIIDYTHGHSSSFLLVLHYEIDLFYNKLGSAYTSTRFCGSM